LATPPVRCVYIIHTHNRTHSEEEGVCVCVCVCVCVSQVTVWRHVVCRPCSSVIQPRLTVAVKVYVSSSSRELPLVYPSLGFFYSQSIHTTLSSSVGHRLSTRPRHWTFSRPDISIDLEITGVHSSHSSVSHVYSLQCHGLIFTSIDWLPTYRFPHKWRARLSVSTNMPTMLFSPHFGQSK
jgi:hypothetical protein